MKCCRHAIAFGSDTVACPPSPILDKLLHHHVASVKGVAVAAMKLSGCSCDSLLGLRVGAKNPAHWTFFLTNPTYWTFSFFLLCVKNVAFCLCFGLFDSLWICRNFVGLRVPERRARKRAKRKNGQSCVLPGGTKPAILAEEELYIYIYMYIESCAFLHQQWGSYLLIIVILSGMTLPRVVHRTNYFTSLIATTGTSFTSLFPRRALI